MFTNSNIVGNRQKINDSWTIYILFAHFKTFWGKAVKLKISFFYQIYFAISNIFDSFSHSVLSSICEYLNISLLLFVHMAMHPALGQTWSGALFMVIINELNTSDAVSHRFFKLKDPPWTLRSDQKFSTAYLQSHLLHVSLFAQFV